MPEVRVHSVFGEGGADALQARKNPVLRPLHVVNRTGEEVKRQSTHGCLYSSYEGIVIFMGRKKDAKMQRRRFSLAFRAVEFKNMKRFQPGACLC
jgi:hypothetical protein